MDKICAKCGFQMRDDDFLCPQCGAIWGDPVYRKPVAAEPVTDTQAGEEEGDIPPENKRFSKRVVTAVTALILLPAIFVLLSMAFGSARQKRGPGDQNIATSSGIQQSTDNMATATFYYITYKITFLDQFGNPIPNVKIMNPYALVIDEATEPYVSDENGIITFTVHEDLKVGIQVLEVPNRYFWKNDASTMYFPSGGTELVITLDLASQHTHSVTMLDPTRLLEPLKTEYVAGETLRIMVKFDASAGYMLFCNGVEVTDYFVYDNKYWMFTMVMPEEDIKLDLKIYDITDLPFQHELLIKAYYRQYPYTEFVAVKHHYGEFASGAAVVIFDTINLTSSYFITGYTVAGYAFFFPNTEAFRVLKGGTFFTLKEAYELDYLTDEDIAQIYKQHLQNYPHLYPDATTPAE